MGGELNQSKWLLRLPHYLGKFKMFMSLKLKKIFIATEQDSWRGIFVTASYECNIEMLENMFENTILFVKAN